MKYSDHQRVNKYMIMLVNKISTYAKTGDAGTDKNTKVNKNHNNTCQGHKVLMGIIFVE